MNCSWYFIWSDYVRPRTLLCLNNKALIETRNPKISFLSPHYDTQQKCTRNDRDVRLLQMCVYILCLCFRASCFNSSNNPTRCNYIGEISPTRCNNCVFYSQWLYSTCFGWQEALRRTTRQRLPTTPQRYNYFKLRGLSPRANYTDRAAAAGRRS